MFGGSNVKQDFDDSLKRNIYFLTMVLKYLMIVKIIRRQIT